MRYVASNKQERRSINSNLALIKVNAHRKQTRDHDKAIVLLASLLKLYANCEVNTDHVKPPIALDKTLKLTDERGRKYDIAFIYEGELFLIEVKRCGNGNRENGKKTERSNNED